jgi:hypothetical protein
MEESNKELELQKEVLQKANAAVKLYFEPMWMKNARANVHNSKYYKKIQHLDFEANKVAVVCGSAPSLALHYDLLKKYRDKITVFAVDTSFPMLLEQGIEADFVTNIDASDCLVERFAFKNIPNTTKFILPPSSPAALFSCLNPKNVYLYTLRDPNSQVLSNIQLMFPHTGAVESKYNVGEFTLYMVKRYFGFKHIIFTGLDFSFTNGNYYANTTINEELHNIDELITMLDIDMKPVQTTRIFRLYCYAFMLNYVRLYSQNMKAIYSLNKGILPLKYDLEAAQELLEAWK